MAIHIARRKFIATLGGATAWPLAARSQQPGRIRRIGVLWGGSETDVQNEAEAAALKKGLQDLGWKENRTYHFEFRWTENDPERTRAYAMEFVHLALDVIVVSATPAAIALRRQTQSIPIIFVNLADPVGTGLVESLAHTGNNVTGFTSSSRSLGNGWSFLKRSRLM